MRISDWSSDVCSSDLAAWGRQGWGRWPARWARSRWGSKRWATRAGNVALTAAYPSRRELDRNGRLYGGEGGIRTHGTRQGTKVFEGSEERRLGKACCRQCRSRWAKYPYKKKQKKQKT